MIQVKNNKEAEDTWCGQTIQPTEYYTIQPTELNRWQSDDKVLQDITNLDLIVSNGVSDIANISDAVDYLKANIIKKVQTRFEDEDKVLHLACGTSTFSGGEAVINLVIPGEFTGVDPETCNGRFAAGGYAFIDAFSFGDKVHKVEVIDVDDLFGYGANFVVKVYHDNDVSIENQGWLFWPEPVGAAVEIEPIGYYGFIPSGLTLRITAKSIEGSPATFFGCNVWWGVKE
jgi:hypothetical protein